MFSFIIINYNTAELTLACLESIFRYCSQVGLEKEIILIDNNSKSGDLEKINNRFGGRIKIIANQKNLGFAAANNQGAKIASGEYLFFLNSDTLINRDILTPLKDAFQQEEKVGIIAPRLLLKNGAEQAYAYGRQKNSQELAWVSGAALIIRKSVFEKIGGWDEKYFMYFEDVDLCRSVLENAYKIKRLDLIAVTHLVGGSPIFYGKRKFYYYRSKLRYIFKH